MNPRWPDYRQNSGMRSSGSSKSRTTQSRQRRGPGRDGGIRIAAHRPRCGLMVSAVNVSNGGSGMRLLYHYTSIERWGLIKAAGHLRTTESNLRQTVNSGPPVVWLTTDAEMVHSHGLAETLDGTDKTRVQIAVELPNRDVHKWREWATRRGITREWMAALIAASGGGAGTWCVTEKPVPASRWVSVVDRSTGERLLEVEQ